MVRFVHSSDLHLGKRFGNFAGDLPGRLREARHAVLGKLAEHARQHGVDTILLAGDTFDTETPAADVRRQALTEMAHHAAIRWVILPGNHDSLQATELWAQLTREAPDNVVLATEAVPIALSDSRRTPAFSIYLIALNLGAFAAPLVCGTLGEHYGWHYGFGAAGLGMLVGVATYVAGWRYLPPDRFHAVRDTAPATPLDHKDWRAVGAVMLSLVPPLILGAALFQAYNLVIVWAEANVDRTIGGWTMPVTWLLTLDGMMTIVGVVITFPVWRWLAKRGRAPDTMQKFIVTSVLITLAYTILAMGSGVAAPAGRLVPLAVVVLFFITLDVSFGWLDPPGNAFVSRFAPARFATTLMSINLMLASGVPNIVVGWLGRFYEPLGPTAFWWLHAGIAASGGVAALLLRPLIARLLDEREATAMLAVPA